MQSSSVAIIQYCPHPTMLPSTVLLSADRDARRRYLRLQRGAEGPRRHLCSHTRCIRRIRTASALLERHGHGDTGHAVPPGGAPDAPLASSHGSAGRGGAFSAPFCIPTAHDGRPSAQSIWWPGQGKVFLKEVLGSHGRRVLWLGHIRTFSSYSIVMASRRTGTVTPCT